MKTIMAKKMTCRFKLTNKNTNVSTFKVKTFYWHIPIDNLGFRLQSVLIDEVKNYIEELYPDNHISITWLKG